jgi:hypothetical protein
LQCQAERPVSEQPAIGRELSLCRIDQSFHVRMLLPDGGADGDKGWLESYRKGRATSGSQSQR